jgi:uncharacterized membrane protein YedE/YeeE
MEHTMNIESYAWSLLGGALIGVSATLLLVLNGRVAGISGIVGGLLKPTRGDVGWRVWFVAGLVSGGIALLVSRPQAFGPATVPAALLVVAGLLVGFGTRLGNGCTSGHGVCGISRLSFRSFVATLTFVMSGGAAAYLVQHVLLPGTGVSP